MPPPVQDSPSLSATTYREYAHRCWSRMQPHNLVICDEDCCLGPNSLNLPATDRMSENLSATSDI